MLASVVIATRNRPAPLAETLRTLLSQSVLPHEVVIVDSSDSQDTKLVVERAAASAPFPVRYLFSRTPSAAGQRNAGIDVSTGDIVMFIDDDVDLDSRFVEELSRPFIEDVAGEVGGVSGTIVNQTYTPPRRVNRFILGLVIGDRSEEWAGRIIGPAVNFLPRDIPDTVQRVEWLNTTGTAYRRSVLTKYRFGHAFSGYSFAEDVHLSCRVAQEYLLLNTTRARFFHHDLGQQTHRDWISLGRSVVINRFEILTVILGRCRRIDHMRFFVYEVLYGTIAAIVSSRLKPKRMRNLAAMMLGKLHGFCIVWSRQGVHSKGVPSNG